MPRSRTTPPRFPALTNDVTTPAAPPPLASDHTEVARRLYETEQRLRESEARYRLLFAASPRPMWVYDPSTLGFLAVNAAAERAYGYTREEFLGMTLRDLRSPETVAELERDVARLASGETASRQSRHVRKDGSPIDVEIASHAFEFEGRPARLVLATDVTARVALEAQLTQQALHDPLTGLANRALFRDRVGHALARTDRTRDAVGVLFLDVDDFKTVNDSLGHHAGDQLLVTVAERLLNATRGCDTVARLGGDEFAVLLENVRTLEDAVTVAERIVRSVRAPFTLGGRDGRVTVSVGVARASGEVGPDELLRDADLAMYRAKARGKGCYQVYEPAMHEALMKRLHFEADLRAAIEGGDCADFALVYQPIVELASGRATGVEALVRWHHPTRGVVPPLSFIPVAEEAGLIVQLGRWVLREACRQGEEWRRAEGMPDLKVSVNLSGRQLADPGLVDDVADALRASGFPATHLVLEITESVMMKNTAAMLAPLHALRALGVRLGIDDFGTGYSSLAYLRNFPIDVLKIDRAFVEGVVRHGTDAALARTIIALGDTLRLETVAEGIEDDQQRAHLRALGCTLGQGYHFARPLPAAAVAAVLRGSRGVLATPAASAPTVPSDEDPR
ncbi:MAG TPA: EAL domain-containing protein [Gemmatimonadaceae bacterium]|nr:EAL domain-containing protein [Gemmatimonadaceae bacterium]